MVAAMIIVYISFVNSMIISLQAIDNLFKFFKLYFMIFVTYIYGFQGIVDSLEFFVIGNMVFDFFRDF